MKSSNAPVKKRFLHFLSEIGITRTECAKKTGITESILRRKDSDLSIESVIKVCRIYRQLNLDWLILGEGDMTKTVPNGYMVVKFEDMVKYCDNAIQTVKDALEEKNSANNELVKTQKEYILQLESCNGIKKMEGETKVISP